MLLPARASAAPTPALPDVSTVMRRMKAALEPSRPSLRDLEIVLHDSDGAETRWTAREASKPTPQGARIAIVMTSPDEVAGAAFLIVEQANKPDVQWDYLPAVRRVRKIVPVGAFHPVLGTDFTYGDLGFVHLEDRSVRLLGVETLAGGSQAYRVEERPQNSWYYARIIDLIATDTLLPVRREFFTPAGDLWKVETFESVTVIDGVATPLVIRMDDRLQGGSTELHAMHVRYDVDIPEAVFEPDGLKRLLHQPVWSAGP
ncbi:MAG: outer membrane lipoprotein-sorting protein [bacterium]